MTTPSIDAASGPQFLGLRREFDRLVLDPVIAPALDGLRVTLPMGSIELEIEYRLGPQGCGVQQVSLDGKDLPFARGANRYRLGAAEIALGDLLPRLQAGSRQLVIHTG